jgi:hypothetical protein
MERNIPARICLSCGKQYKPTGTAQKLCGDCSPALKVRTSVKTPRTCLNCSLEYQATSPRQKYCKTCSPVMEKQWSKQYNKEYNKRRLGIYPLAGRICVNCQTIYDAINGRQKYCEACSFRKRVRLRVHKSGRTRRLLKLRFTILIKFKFTCQYCGRRAPDVILHIDHVIPKSRGGTNSMGNYTVACADCNIGKGDCLLSNKYI